MNGTMQNNAGFQPQSAIAMALSRGYIVASAGARGRKSRSVSGTYSGKAPAAIVDLKAAICYLKYNDKVMPGDASKIISNGTSAGGALSALLGATGNNPDYFPYLKEIGDLCEIKKSLTFHLARHTFATTITLSQGVPIV
jgi:hypothetical protein